MILPVRQHRQWSAFSVIGAGVMWLLAGCVGPTIMLQPMASPDEAGIDRRSVRLFVHPVSESPDLSRREAALLTALYTAVWVRVQNDSTARRHLDPSELLLYDSSGTPWLPLDPGRRESYRRWRPWGFSRFVRQLFYRSRIASLEERLDTLTLSAGWVEPGSAVSGLLLYKPVDGRHCQSMVLEWSGEGPEEGVLKQPSDDQTRSSATQAALHC